MELANRSGLGNLQETSGPEELPRNIAWSIKSREIESNFCRADTTINPRLAYQLGISWPRAG